MDGTQDTPTPQPETPQPRPHRPWYRRRGFLVGLIGSSAVAGMFAARPLFAAVRGGGWCSPRWGHHGAMNPEAMHEHLQVAVKWALKDVDATDEQTAKVQAIVKDAVDDLHALRDKHHAHRQAFAEKLVAASVDRDGLEEIRKAELALGDEASKRVVQALADVAEVLSVEQRQALVERAKRRHGG